MALDPLPHRLDVAGHLVPNDTGQFGGVRVEPDSRHRVGEVDAGCLDRDPDLAPADRRVGPLLKLEDLGGAVLSDYDGAHRKDPTPPAPRRRPGSEVDRAAAVKTV